MGLLNPLLFKLKNISARNKLRYGVGILVLLIAAGGFIYASKTGKIRPFAATGGGTVTGKVYNRDGQPIAGAKITATAPFTLSGQAISTSSAADGSYSISGLKQDTALYFEKDGPSYPTPFTDISDALGQKFVGALYNAATHPEKFNTHSWLQNTGLEDWTDGLPNNWLKNGNVGIAQEEDNTREGLSSVKINLDSAGQGALIQAVQNLPPGNYYLSAWVKVDSGQAGLVVSDPQANFLVNPVLTGPTDWRKIYLTFPLTAARPLTYIALEGIGPFSAYFDDIRLLTTLSPEITCSPTTFCPNNPANREQTAVFMSYLMDLDVTQFSSLATPACNFTDTSREKYSWPFIQAACAAGVFRGTTATTFGPNDSLARAQLALVLSRALKLEPYEAFTASFTDVPKDSSELYTAVETLYLAGITNGCQIDKFCPNDTLARGQLAIFLGRAFQNIELTQGGFTPRKVTFSVADGQTGNYDIYLSPTGKVGKISGKTTDVNGAAIAGATVVVSLEPSISENYSTITGADGSFLITNVPEGSYGYYILKPNSPDVYQLNNWENAVFVDADQVSTIDASGLQ